MRHHRALLAICGIFLIVSACSPTAPPKVTPSSASSAGSVAPSTGTSPTSSAISPDAVSAVDTMLANMTSQSVFSGSVLIAQHGHVLLSKGYGLADRAQKTPNDQQTRFAIGSNTKQFTAASILLLEVQGKLKVTDLICTYIPQCPSAWGVITIKELLTHTSGIPAYTALPDFVDYEGQPSTPLQIIAHFRDLPLDFAPGSTFSYDNSGYILLGYIIEQVSGLSYEAFLQKYILSPLNLSDTGYNHNSNGVAIGYSGEGLTPAVPVDPSIPYAAGGLYSTVGDMNRWEQALTTDELLPATLRAEMFAPQVAIPEGGGYGYGFFIAPGVIFHGGDIPGFHSFEARYPVDDVTLIILVNQDSVDVATVLGGVWTKIYNAKP